MSSNIPVMTRAAGSCLTTPMFKYALPEKKRRWKGCFLLFVTLAMVGSIGNMRCWTIQANGKVASAAVKSKPTGNAETSLTAYFKRPLVELRSVKMAYGASMEHKGPNPNAPGEELFEVKVPPINFPGLFKIQPVAICTVRATEKGLQVEGQRVDVLGAGENAMKNAQFNMLGEMQWTDTPSKQDVSFKCKVKLGLVPNAAAKAVMPQFLFERIGNKAMGLSMDMLVKGFARSFAEDYERWAKAQSQSQPALA